MRNLILLATLILTFSSCAYQRIGDLNFISNRNIDSNTEYFLIERNVTSTIRMKKDDVLERAIDEATEAHNGEYLMNAKIFVKNNGKRIKVIGDVWGVEKEKLLKEITDGSVAVGDKVIFQTPFKGWIEGKLIGVKKGRGVVEFKNKSETIKMRELPLDQITKIE